MDPYTGEILGMASRPTFDPNAYYKYSYDSFNNRAVGFTYEPGSVFKPLVGCMGLTEGIITPNTPFQDSGSIRIADRVIHNWDSEGMGVVPFSTVIKFSINTGMVQLGMQLGAERMTSYAASRQASTFRVRRAAFSMIPRICMSRILRRWRLVRAFP